MKQAKPSRLLRVLCGVLVIGSAVAPAAQQPRFDDVIRNLRNPDPKVRLAAVQLLRESKYPEAIGPLAPLVNDPIDQIQLEAIAAELSFFLVQDVPSKKRVGFLVEVRNPGRAPVAFEMGPLAVLPRPVPSDLIENLLKAVDDENAKVRSEAIYAFGTIVPPPAPESTIPALIKAVNDSQSPVRYAAMRALGEIHDRRAVQALTEQFNFYGKGEGAWSALDALAHLADPASVPIFKAHLADRDPFLRRASAEGLARVGDTSEVPALEIGAGNDSSEMVRAAMAFALQKLGRNYIPRLVESLDSDKDAPQAAAYLIELGPSISSELVPLLQDPSPAIRANVATVLGAVGGDAAVAALQPLAQDKDRTVAQAAARALERINSTAATK